MTHNSMFTYLAALLVIFCAISLFYWTVAQPVLVRRCVFRLFALRDDLRWEQIKGELDEKDENVQTLNHIIGAIIANASMISLLRFIVFCIRTRNDEIPEEIERYQREAPETVKKFNHSAIEISYFVMLINSPLIGSLLILIACIAALRPSITVVRQKVKEFIMAKENEKGYANAFISEMPVQTTA